MATKDSAPQSVKIDRIELGLEALSEQRDTFHALASALTDRFRMTKDANGDTRDVVGLKLSEHLEDLLASAADFKTARALMGLPEWPAKEESHA